MGHPLKIPTILIAGLMLAACEDADIKGMFISDTSVNQRFEESLEWNAMHLFREIVVPADDYHILSMGDSHVGGTLNLDTMLARAMASDAVAVVMAGDLTTGHAEDYALFEEHLPNQDSLPSFLIPGNHDLYFKGWEEFYARFGSSTYFFTIETPAATDLFICLDSGGGTLGNLQLGWLKEVLENIRPGHRRCVIFTHNNLFRFRRTTSTNPNVEELVVLLDLFSEYHVDMVVTAHDHRQYAQTFGNTWHIVMDALKDGLSNAGYFELHLSNGDLSYSFVNFN